MPDRPDTDPRVARALARRSRCTALGYFDLSLAEGFYSLGVAAIQFSGPLALESGVVRQYRSFWCARESAAFDL